MTSPLGRGCTLKETPLLPGELSTRSDAGVLGQGSGDHTHKLTRGSSVSKSRVSETRKTPCSGAWPRRMQGTHTGEIHRAKVSSARRYQSLPGNTVQERKRGRTVHVIHYLLVAMSSRCVYTHSLMPGFAERNQRCIKWTNDSGKRVEARDCSKTRLHIAFYSV